MRLIVFGDVHDHQDRLTATLELLEGEAADLVVLTGDVGCDPPWREPARSGRRQTHDESVRRVIERVAVALGGPVVYVPGNHDLPRPVDDSGAINLDGRVESVAGLRLLGLGGAGPDHFGFPYEWEEEQATAALSAAAEWVVPGEIDLFLSHAPPARTPLDRIHDGRHVGSESVDAAIERLQPRLFVCGHIHEAWGVTTHHGVPCLNGGALGEPYGQCLAWIVDWDGGPRAITSVRRRNGGPPERRDWPL